jgi:hypothetical protein
MRPGMRTTRIERMKSVEREYRVAIVARDALIEALQADPSTLTNQGLEQADFLALRRNLDSTYLIRLFAEFETGLREYWKQRMRKTTVPRVADLITSISSNRDVHHRDMARVDEVRKYRNKLVHEEDSEAQVVEMREARKFLCIFFGKLPEDW